jgi:rubrerythrin
MTELWRCEICGDPYVGDDAPSNCPFCGAKKKFIKKASDAVVDFDIELTEKDRANVEHALDVEISNSIFYACAAAKSDDAEGRLLFKALKKVEAEHASIWKKVLKLKEFPAMTVSCHRSNKENLEDSHKRETDAIEFYRKAAEESNDARIKEIFDALVDVETDHLKLSEARLK